MSTESLGAMALPTPQLRTGRAIASHVFFYLLIDILISVSPFRRKVDRWFYVDGPQQAKEARRTRAQFAMRVVGYVFLTIMFPRAIKVLFSPTLRADPLYATDANSEMMIAVTAAYFVYDVLICFVRFRASGGMPFLAHGLISGSAFLYSARTHMLQYFGGMVLLWEASTPLLYARWMMLKSRRHKSRWMSPVNYAFMTLFFLARIVWAPMVYRTFFNAVGEDQALHPERAMSKFTSNLFWVGFVMMGSLNLYWFSMMVRAAAGRSHDKHKAV